MANRNRRNGWESSLLAAALAVVGTLFFLDKLGSLMSSTLSLQAVVHAAPVMVVVLGISLLLADHTAVVSRNERSREGRHE